MKNKLILLAIGGSLLLASPALRAENSSTNKHAGGTPGKPPQRGDNLISHSMIEKLNLSEDQKKKIKGIEESWDKARKDYMDSHKAEADAAKAASEEARKSDDPAKKKDAAEKRRQVFGGLKPIRDQYVTQVNSVLSDEQKKTLEEERKKRGGPPGPKPDKAKPKDANGTDDKK